MFVLFMKVMGCIKQFFEVIPPFFRGDWATFMNFIEIITFVKCFPEFFGVGRLKIAEFFPNHFIVICLALYYILLIAFSNLFILIYQNIFVEYFVFLLLLFSYSGMIR